MINEQHQYRYPGSRAFRQSESSIFTGRSTDVDKLSQLIAIEKIAVLFGNVGCGKTSLINAGLIPKIESERNSEIIHFSFNHFDADKNLSIFNNIHDILESKNSENQSLLDKLIPDEDSLWYHLKKCQTPENNEFIIIIDDFDNFFSYPAKEQQFFKRELSTLLFTKIPQNFRNEMNRKPCDSDNLFSDNELDILHNPLNVRLLVVIHSENLSKLNHVKDFIPGIMQYCQELRPLTVSNSINAIKKPASYTEPDMVFSSPTFTFDNEAVNKIINFNSMESESYNVLINSPIKFNVPDEEEETDLFQMQIICKKAEQIAIEKSKTATDSQIVVTASDLGDLNDIFKEYYETLYNTINDNNLKDSMRILIEEGLILEDEKYRLSLYEGIILKRYNVKKDNLLKIVDYQLVRIKTGHWGGNYYEISHDVFLPAIHNSRKERLELQRLEAHRKEIERVKEEVNREHEEKMERLRKEDEAKLEWLRELDKRQMEWQKSTDAEKLEQQKKIDAEKLEQLRKEDEEKLESQKKIASIELEWQRKADEEKMEWQRKTAEEKLEQQIKIDAEKQEQLRKENEEKLELLQKESDERLEQERKQNIAKLAQQRKVWVIRFLTVMCLILIAGILYIYDLKENEKTAKEESNTYNSLTNLLLKTSLPRLSTDDKRFIFDTTDSIVYKLEFLKEQNYEKSIKTAEIYCSIYDSLKMNNAYRSEAYANQAWYLFFARDFDKALKMVKKASDMNNDTLWIKENLALAYFLTNQFDKGKEIYEMIKNDSFPQTKTTFKQQFIDDFDRLKKEGIIPPDEQKIRELLK